ncbi:MAG: hypothetical protein QWI73_01430 [Alphaproteobacteria bacterium]|nr:hypothetical protein [Alphaproteobacteria bacterium]
MEFALNFPVNIKNLPKNGLALTFTASKKECEALASNHALQEVEAFCAVYRIFRENADIIKLTGEFTAQIKQNCVSTGELISQELCKKIDARFVKARARAQQQPYIVEDTEFFELYSGDFIDIGQVTEELFELAIDHYPHSPNAQPIVFSAPADIDRGEANDYSPFSVLKQYKDKKGA